MKARASRFTAGKRRRCESAENSMRNFFSFITSKNARLMMRCSVARGALLAALLFAFSGCVSPERTAAQDKPTLAGNPRLPQGDMEKFFKIGRAPSELQSPDHLVCRLLLEKTN